MLHCRLLKLCHELLQDWTLDLDGHLQFEMPLFPGLCVAIEDFHLLRVFRVDRLELCTAR